MLWCFLCPWTFIFQALRHLSGFHDFFMCLWQLLVRFEISPFYQDFRFGSQTRFDNKSYAFIAVLDATIIKPMLLLLYFQNIQKYKKNSKGSKYSTKIQKKSKYTKKSIKNQKKPKIVLLTKYKLWSLT